MLKYKKYNWYVSLADMAKAKPNNFPKYLIIHHAASNASFEDVQEYHIAGRALQGKTPFNNIGYHFYILKTGEVKQGRPLHHNGAHAVGYNTKSIGICLQGNYSIQKTPPKAQKEALRKLMKSLRLAYDIPLTNIKPHRSVDDTECYGKNLPDNWARDLLVNAASSLDEFSTYDLLKSAYSRKDFYQAVVKLFS